MDGGIFGFDLECLTSNLCVDAVFHPFGTIREFSVEADTGGVEHRLKAALPVRAVCDCAEYEHTVSLRPGRWSDNADPYLPVFLPRFQSSIVYGR